MNANRANLHPDVLLHAYAVGAFPMADPDGVIRWYVADPRGVLPLDQFHCPRTLRQLVRQGKFDIRINCDFEATMRGCKDAVRPEGHGGWINEELVQAYVRLHKLGYAHSVEAYLDNQLVGGLYGVAIGGAFFGESMFHRVSNASKVCLVHLVERLRQRGYVLLDTQMVTDHMRQFGTTHISGNDYQRQLQAALRLNCSFV